MTITLILASGGAIVFMLTFLAALTKETRHGHARQAVAVLRSNDDVIHFDDAHCGNCAA